MGYFAAKFTGFVRLFVLLRFGLLNIWVIKVIRVIRVIKVIWVIKIIRVIQVISY